MTIQKIITANDYINGGAVVYHSEGGQYQSIDPEINHTGVIVQQTGILETRFDDVTYYSA